MKKAFAKKCIRKKIRSSLQHWNIPLLRAHVLLDASKGSKCELQIPLLGTKSKLVENKQCILLTF